MNKTMLLAFVMVLVIAVGLVPAYADSHPVSRDYFIVWQEWAYKIFDWYKYKIENLEKENQELKDFVQNDNNTNHQQFIQYKDTVSKLETKIKKLENNNAQLVSENSQLKDNLENMLNKQDKTNKATPSNQDANSNAHKIIVKINNFSEYRDTTTSLFYSGHDIYRAKTTIENLSDDDVWLSAYVIQGKSDYKQEWLFDNVIDMNDIPPNIIREGFFYVKGLDLNKNYETVFENSLCFSNCPLIVIEQN